MFTSGVPLSPLGSLKDRVLRDFMFKESRKSLKYQELQLAIALLNTTDDKARNAIQSIWKDLVRLELGFDVDIQVSEDKPESAWIAEYEHMKSMNVQIARKKGGGLEVTGLPTLR